MPRPFRFSRVLRLRLRQRALAALTLLALWLALAQPLLAAVAGAAAGAAPARRVLLCTPGGHEWVTLDEAARPDEPATNSATGRAQGFCPLCLLPGLPAQPPRAVPQGVAARPHGPAPLRAAFHSAQAARAPLPPRGPPLRGHSCGA